MTVLSVVDAFQTANASITGIVGHPAAAGMPGQLTADLLPCAITLPGAATWHHAGLGGGRKCQRVYVVRYFVAAASAESGQTYNTLLGLMEAAGLFWRAQKTVGGAMIRAVEDAGALRTLGYGGEQFFGFEERVTVEEPA